MKLSAVVLTKNEEKNIVDCLESLQFCDEIIVVDDGSEDRTIELLQRFDKNVKVFKRDLDKDFSKQRMFGVEKASNDWIIFIDADERITEKLAIEIKRKLSRETNVGGYLIKRIDFMWGKELKHGETGDVKLLRLFDRRRGSLKGKVHETWETSYKVEELSNSIIHYPHPTISQFLKEINFYTDLRVGELYESGAKSSLVNILLYTVGKFVRNFILKLGFLDGTPGLIHALLMSFHSFLVRGKLWFLWQKK